MAHIEHEGVQQPTEILNGRHTYKFIPETPYEEIKLVHDGQIGDWHFDQVMINRGEFEAYVPNDSEESMLGTAFRHIQNLQTYVYDEDGDLTRFTKETLRSTLSVYQDIVNGTSNETLESDEGLYRVIQNTLTDDYTRFIQTDSNFAVQVGSIVDNGVLNIAKESISLGLFGRDDAFSGIDIVQEGIRLDAELVHITGKTLIEDGVIKTAMIGDAQISSAKIADAAINNAKIANLDVNKLVGNRSNFIQSYWNSINSNISITGSSLTATHRDGSQTIINANGLYHREGNSSYSTNYLTDVYTISGIRNTNDLNTYNQINGLIYGPYWYQLPAVYRGKRFKASVSLADPYGYVSSSDYGNSAMSRFVVLVGDNIDYANARVPIIGYVTKINLESKVITGHAIQVQLVVTY